MISASSTRTPVPAIRRSVSASIGEPALMGQRHPVWRCGIEHGQVTNADQWQ
jgi:hypothetical protein